MWSFDFKKIHFFTPTLVTMNRLLEFSLIYGFLHYYLSNHPPTLPFRPQQGFRTVDGTTSKIEHLIAFSHSSLKFWRFIFPDYNLSTIGDQHKWFHHASGQYSVKSAGAALVSNLSSPQSFFAEWGLEKKKLKLTMQTRLNFFIWKVVSSFLSRSLL